MAIERKLLIKACDLALAGDWQSAHEIVQQDEDDAISCWIHAIVHRIEGDDANAAYWYRAAGRPGGPSNTPEEELHIVRAELAWNPDGPGRR